ncbi:putative Auxin Efflux Carrier (AEC) Family Protein [Monocercomonoides exilis]|uniref:putative Auxin Efflux Carrier (AEC) Family Protein n=1 Tax=Monocercomonoides exilis TaxID=2049356 RepID=UPI0035593B3D|nr:putative Auxin Efflux Carrier (AEC) Family Protein [Monocercomonoides exilis]|eukprot:MONOS_13505.1-p1 / transcript=MONOS_13505.1 / gene=MONOS_13505 / organism=Monocercomonoides_exilis_PA203 / gene_product=Auxin Efflux Carrier (AEC) Family Protein / transcript_product=Auxin Efflux Carrier (AEC) Family Protein / location=Mono_scaffold00837:22194-23470(+) / protein_length=381 / sequence_SO=supercontig / SO=protein_coding / is_pseudo=false
MMIICAIPALFTKKMTLDLYNILQLNANYSNNIVYGIAFLVTTYPEYNMGLLCVLSAIPDSVYLLPFSLFLFEYTKLKKKVMETNSNFHFTVKDSLKLVPKVIFRVATNVLVWAIILGFILNFARIKKPLWLDTFITQTSSSNISVVMFNIGLFSAHAPALKINWKAIKLWFKSKKRSRKGSDEEKANLTEMGEDFDSVEISPSVNSDESDSSVSSSSLSSVITQRASSPSIKSSSAEPSQSESSSSSVRTNPEHPPRHSSAASSSSNQNNARPKLNIPLVFILAFIRYLLSPAVMLAVLYIPCFSSTSSSPFSLRPDQQHAAVLINALPLAVMVFSLSKEFNVYSGEIVTTIVIQLFLLIFPFFVLWSVIMNKLFPLPV